MISVSHLHKLLDSLHKEAVMNEGEEINIDNFQPEDDDEIEVNEIPF